MYEREQKKTDLIDNNLDPAQIKIGIESSSNRNLITSGKQIYLNMYVYYRQNYREK